jgi:hypothetical protein
MATLPELFATLRSKSGFEVVSHTPSATRLRVLGRLPLDREGMNINNWVVLVARLLTATEQGKPWSVDVSKHYFKRDGKLVYAWRLLFQAEEIEKHYADIMNVAKNSPGAKRPEPEEVRLYGRESNDTSGGKRGAGALGSVAVGPIAVFSKQHGG